MCGILCIFVERKKRGKERKRRGREKGGREGANGKKEMLLSMKFR